MVDPAQPDEITPLSATAQSNEQELIARVRAGDEQAFESIFDTYYAALVALAHSYLHSRESAEEIVQDLFLSLWAQRTSWEVTQSLRAYLCQAVRNRVLNRRRTLRLERKYEEIVVREMNVAGEWVAPGQTDDVLAERELKAALDAAVLRLPERCREVFLLNRKQHLSYAEVAGMLGISVQTVKMHMTRALGALREALADWDR